MQGLLECPSIAVLDIQNNKIEDPSLVELLMQMPNLKVLYLIGNPVIKNIQNYRKTMIAKLKHLTHLDDRPVFPDERRTSEAWFNGGIEAERKARDDINREKKEEDDRNWQAFSKLITQGRSEEERFAKYADVKVDNVAPDGDKDIFDELEEQENNTQSNGGTFITEIQPTSKLHEEQFTRVVIGEVSPEIRPEVNSEPPVISLEPPVIKSSSYEDLD